VTTDNSLPDPVADPADQRIADQVAMILAAIADVAPELEAELAHLDHDVDFWTELELDSMDHLSVMTRLATQTGRDIPEIDYPHLTTVNQISTYLGGPVS
jgi:acyl carrier protein